MLDKINSILNEVLGIPIKKFIVDHKKERYRHSEVYKNANTAAKADLLFAETKKIFQGLNKFKLNFYGIYALKELVDRERKIQAFMAHEYFKVWVVYRVGGIEFVAFYPSVFDKDTIKEMDDLLADLKSSKYQNEAYYMEDFLLHIPSYVLLDILWLSCTLFYTFLVYLKYP